MTQSGDVMRSFLGGRARRRPGAVLGPCGVCVALAAALALVGGCGQGPNLTRDAERGEAAIETMAEEAGAAALHIEKARAGTETSAGEVRAAAEKARAVPAARPFAVKLAGSADRLDEEVAGELDAALRSVESVRASSGEAASLVATVTDLRAERDRWQAEAAREKQRADSAVRKWLLVTAAGGFAGLLAGGALFVWLSRRAGLVVGLASLAVFAVSVALYRWLEWIAWGGLVLIVLAVGGLAYGLWRNRDALRAVVLGGENLRALVADGAAYTREQIEDLFRKSHGATQKAASSDVEGVVREVKRKEGV